MLEKIIRRISRIFNGISLAALTCMLVVVAVDIIAAKLFSSPMTGSMDYVSLLSILVIGFSIPQSYRMDRHIKVAFITVLMPVTMRRIVQCISHLLCFIFFALIVWRMFIYAGYVWTHGEKSLTVKLPVYPFVYALAVCFVPMLMILPLQLINIWKKNSPS